MKTIMAQRKIQEAEEQRIKDEEREQKRQMRKQKNKEKHVIDHTKIEDDMKLDFRFQKDDVTLGSSDQYLYQNQPFQNEAISPKIQQRVPQQQLMRNIQINQQSTQYELENSNTLQKSFSPISDQIGADELRNLYDNIGMLDVVELEKFERLSAVLNSMASPKPLINDLKYIETYQNPQYKNMSHRKQIIKTPSLNNIALDITSDDFKKNQGRIVNSPTSQMQADQRKYQDSALDSNQHQPSTQRDTYNDLHEIEELCVDSLIKESKFVNKSSLGRNRERDSQLSMKPGDTKRLPEAEDARPITDQASQLETEVQSPVQHNNQEQKTSNSKRPIKVKLETGGMRTPKQIPQKNVVGDNSQMPWEMEAKYQQQPKIIQHNLQNQHNKMQELKQKLVFAQKKGVTSPKEQFQNKHNEVTKIDVKQLNVLRLAKPSQLPKSGDQTYRLRSKAIMSQCSNRGPQIIKQLRNQYPQSRNGQISKSINFEASSLEFNTSAIITNHRKIVKGPTTALKHAQDHSGLFSANQKGRTITSQQGRSFYQVKKLEQFRRPTTTFDHQFRNGYRNISITEILSSKGSHDNDLEKTTAQDISFIQKPFTPMSRQTVMTANQDLFRVQGSIEDKISASLRPPQIPEKKQRFSIKRKIDGNISNDANCQTDFPAVGELDGVAHSIDIPQLSGFNLNSVKNGTKLLSPLGMISRRIPKFGIQGINRYQNSRKEDNSISISNTSSLKMKNKIQSITVKGYPIQPFSKQSDQLSDQLKTQTDNYKARLVNHSVTLDIPEDMTLVQEFSPASRTIDKDVPRKEKEDVQKFKPAQIQGLRTRNVIHSKGRINKYQSIDSSDSNTSGEPSPYPLKLSTHDNSLNVSPIQSNRKGVIKIPGTKPTWIYVQNKNPMNLQLQDLNIAQESARSKTSNLSKCTRKNCSNKMHKHKILKDFIKMEFENFDRTVVFPRVINNEKVIKPAVKLSKRNSPFMRNSPRGIVEKIIDGNQKQKVSKQVSPIKMIEVPFLSLTKTEIYAQTPGSKIRTQNITTSDTNVAPLSNDNKKNSLDQNQMQIKELDEEQNILMPNQIIEKIMSKQQRNRIQEQRNRLNSQNQNRNLKNDDLTCLITKSEEKQNEIKRNVKTRQSNRGSKRPSFKINKKNTIDECIISHRQENSKGGAESFMVESTKDRHQQEVEQYSVSLNNSTNDKMLRNFKKSIKLAKDNQVDFANDSQKYEERFIQRHLQKRGERQINYIQSALRKQSKVMRQKNRVSFENEGAMFQTIRQSQNRSTLGEESYVSTKENIDLGLISSLQNVQIAANSRNENPDIQQKLASIQKRNDFGNLQYRKLTGSFMDEDNDNVDSLVGPSVASVVSKAGQTSPNPPVFDCNPSPRDDTMFAVTSRNDIITTERKHQKDQQVAPSTDREQLDTLNIAITGQKIVNLQHVINIFDQENNRYTNLTTSQNQESVETGSEVAQQPDVYIGKTFQDMINNLQPNQSLEETNLSIPVVINSHRSNQTNNSADNGLDANEVLFNMNNQIIICTNSKDTTNQSSQKPKDFSVNISDTRIVESNTVMQNYAQSASQNNTQLVILSSEDNNENGRKSKIANESPLVMVNDSKGYILQDLIQQELDQNNDSSTPEIYEGNQSSVTGNMIQIKKAQQFDRRGQLNDSSKLLKYEDHIKNIDIIEKKILETPQFQMNGQIDLKVLEQYTVEVQNSSKKLDESQNQTVIE